MASNQRFRRGGKSGLGLVVKILILLLLVYLTYSVWDLKSSQNLFSLESGSDSGVLDIDDEDTAGSNQLAEDLEAAIKRLAQSQEVKEKITALEKDYATLADRIKLPEGYDYLAGERYIVADGLTVMAFAIDQEDGNYLVNLPHERRMFTDKTAFDKFLAGLSGGESELSKFKQLASSKKKLAENLIAELDKEKPAQLLADKALQVEVKASEAHFVNNEQAVLLTINFDPENNRYLVNNDINDTFAGVNLGTRVGQLITELDTRTELQKIMDRQKEEFEEVLKSEDFAALLKDYNLQLGELVERPDSYLLSVSKNESVVFNLILEKGTGLVRVQYEGQILPLEEFLSGDKKKTSDDDVAIASSGSNSDYKEVILLAGKHGSLTDTMILAFIDDDDSVVKLVSIPRDLSWQGRKINSYFALGGMPYLVSQLEQITKVKITHYVLVDMYAFIDVVNILGGIDITLTEAVIDPTYKTFDDGKWGTLNYQPGSYHLSGVQALRLARSRHTSSDFARAERQQKILRSLQNKAMSLSFKDLPTIIALAKAVLARVETDLSLNDAMAYYQAYKDFEVQNRGVLTSGNILYSTYSNQDGYDACLVSGPLPGEECSKGAYILLPLNNNWSNIPSYIRGLIRN